MYRMVAKRTLLNFANPLLRRYVYLLMGVLIGSAVFPPTLLTIVAPWRRRYVYLLMGVLIGSAVFPIAYCLCWSKCSAVAAISGAFSGQFAAIIAWLVYTSVVEGPITVENTGAARFLHGMVGVWDNRVCD